MSLDKPRKGILTKKNKLQHDNLIKNNTQLFTQLKIHISYKMIHFDD